MRQSTASEARRGLADVSELSLRDLDECDPSALALALREVLDPTRRDGDPVARFQACADQAD